jgi:putative nucleotidyltransferase with HDIG domain
MMSKTNKPKSAARREELRRTLPKPTAGLSTVLQRPEFVQASLLLLAFIALASTAVIWSREQPRVDRGQIMTATRVNRVPYEVEDVEATGLRREEARESSPRVYRLNDPYLEQLEHALNFLPKAVAGKTSLSEISEEVVQEFRLTEDGLVALQKYAVEGDTTGAWETTGIWQGWVTQLIDQRLRRYPLLESEEYQKYSKTLNRALLHPGGPLVRLTDESYAIELTEDPFDRLDDIVRRGGFRSDVAPFVQARLAWQPRATFLFDPVETEAIAVQEAEAVEPVMVPHGLGEIIYKRGDRLTAAQYEQLLDEMAAYRASANPWQIWSSRLGIIGLIALLTIFGGRFVAGSYPRIVRNAARVVAISMLMGGALVLAEVLSTQVPKLTLPAAIAAALFVTIIIQLAYDQRLALFLATVECALITLALGKGIGWFVLLMAGCGLMVAQLREVRHRNSLIRAAITTAAVLGVGTLVLGLLIMPPVEGLWLYLVSQASWAVGASMVVGFLVLGILPSIERLFDITTGMTLAELRDPSQALLRQLQQRAPGTYNHSLQVANIAEAAADAIGADSLLVYVGALYHDVGKMNKPEYFVENQTGGINKHNKLRPAMSLLLIIGHVKDGIELAREYGLPRSLQHFIESHHGTTLVEYFFHAAKTQAQADDKGSVNEVEFRYPGPKPRTKEAAILMLADAVESATRAMTEPNPRRIESLVRELSRKRLLDGQFNECDLTFRELGLIEEAAIHRLNAIHHGRISYPSQKSDEGEAATPAKSTA